MGNLTYSGEAEWHALRQQHVGASEVAALFGLSPWQTKWQLHMIKSGRLPPVDLSSNTAVSAGRFMEAGVASWAAEKFDVTLNKVRRYLRDDECPGLGASLDFESVGTGTRFPVEIKFIQRSDGWNWEGDDLTEVPQNYLLQLQAQIACCGAEFGELIAFVGGDIRRMRVPRSQGIVTAIRRHVEQFWAGVREKIEPPVDFLADAGALSELAYGTPLRTITLSPDAAPIFAALQDAKARAKAADEEATAAQAELVKLVLDAGIGNDDKARATCGKYNMSLTKVQPNPGKIVTADMLGTVIGKRKGYLTTRITESDDV